MATEHPQGPGAAAPAVAALSARPAVPLHGAPAAWCTPDDDLTLRCIDVRRETHDVSTFAFAADDGRWVAFQAGQYLPIEVEIDGEVHGRCYSLSSSALQPQVLAVTVKRVAGGRVSNWLHDHLRPGMTLRSRPPAGGFVLPALDGAAADAAGLPPMWLVSGGSGITPVMAMLRTLADARCHPDIVFLHAGRTPADLVFRDELQWRARTTPGLRLLFLPESVAGEPGYTGVTGRLGEGLLQALVPDLARRRVLCCGPAPFMAAVRTLSAALGVPAAHYSEESFTGGDLAVAPSAEPGAAAVATASTTPEVAGQDGATAAPAWTVTFSKQDRCVPVAAGQTVLAAARQAGISIPSSCGNGLCGTCKSRLSAGKVEMAHTGGIRQREIDAGFFLPCCAKPVTDLVVER
ncbi:hybrid-cluster NAD(P)-dependent oxidoreductase [Pseudaquabacterium rugosum]|uniref:Hybrid-cluster NAD(P)-dependent oxidoreductase n=1 Tax=Pseudaquabacterium rugosum TaxID=2984194 RepID=A0ABU9BBA2_9BURK